MSPLSPEDQERQKNIEATFEVVKASYKPNYLQATLFLLEQQAHPKDFAILRDIMEEEYKLTHFDNAVVAQRATKEKLKEEPFVQGFFISE